MAGRKHHVKLVRGSSPSDDVKSFARIPGPLSRTAAALMQLLETLYRAWLVIVIARVLVSAWQMFLVLYKLIMYFLPPGL